MTLYDSAALYDSATLYDGIGIPYPVSFKVSLVNLPDFFDPGSAAVDDTTGTALARRFDIQRGRAASSFGAIEPGRATIELDDTTSALFPQNDDLCRIGSLCIVTALPTNASRRNLFTGRVDEVDTSWAPGSRLSEVTLTATDCLRRLAETDVAHAGNIGDSPTTRIGAILDLVQIDSLLRYLDTGTVTNLLPDTAEKQSALSAIDKVVQSESGAFFANTDDRPVFLGRALAWPETEPTVVFNDDPVARECAYMSIAVKSSRDPLINSVTVSTVGLDDQEIPDQTYSDATSIGEAGQRDETVSTLLDSEGAMLVLAQHLVDKRGHVDYVSHRIEALTFDAYASEANLWAAMKLDLFHVIQVDRGAPGYSWTANLVVVGIRHEVETNPPDWRVTLTTQAQL